MDFVLIIIWVWNLMLERTNDSFWWEWWLTSRWFLLSNAMIWKACNLENKLWLKRDCWLKFTIFVANILLLDNVLKTKPLSLYLLLLDSKRKLFFVWTTIYMDIKVSKIYLWCCLPDLLTVSQMATNYSYDLREYIS